MPSDKDGFWDDLGVAWRASIPDSGLFSSRLEARLRRQEAFRKTGAILCVVAGAAALGLGLWALWIGWSSHTWNFLTRGATLLGVTVLAVAAASTLRVRGEVDTRSLHEMLQSSITRTERLVRAADLGCVSLAIIAVGGLAGYAIRTRLGRAPLMSPIEDLLALAVVVIGVLAYRWSQARALVKYRHLIQMFSSENDAHHIASNEEIGQ
jgi:hypothetical protein